VEWISRIVVNARDAFDPREVMDALTAPAGRKDIGME
jgi:hypothetical protein